MVDYSTTKTYLEKHNLHYFTLSPNSEKSIKPTISRFLPDRPAEGISNNVENFSFKVINLR
jgi:hypothetical protein